MDGKLSEVWDVIEQVASRNGALRVGASRLEDEHVALFEQWLAAGHHGSMEYLRRHATVRTNPRERYPWARSVVVITVPYSPERPSAPEGALSHGLARYALGDDYHDVLDTILREIEAVIAAAAPEAKTWRYVDTGPMSDRSYGAQAGLGWIGRNGMLIDERNGSYFFIGTLLTSLENDVDASLAADRCGTCTRCIVACPTEAILPDRTVVSQLCISHATIEQRGAIPSDVASRLVGNVFGCDICQEVCPWNSKAPEGHPAFAPREAYRATPVTDLLRLAQADFSALFRRSAIKRAKRAGMARNALLTGAQGEVAEDLRGDEGVAAAIRDAASAHRP